MNPLSTARYRERLSTSGEPPPVREELASVSEPPEEPTLLSVDAEPGETPTTRIRTTTDEPESRLPSEAPPPLRKVKGDKSEGDAGTPAVPAPARVPLGTPLTTPMRAPNGQIGARPAGTDPIDGEDGPAPESGGGGGAS